MTSRDLATLEKWFGSRGKFPPVKINTGELGIEGLKSSPTTNEKDFLVVRG